MGTKVFIHADSSSRHSCAADWSCLKHNEVALMNWSHLHFHPLINQLLVIGPACDFPQDGFCFSFCCSGRAQIENWMVNFEWMMSVKTAVNCQRKSQWFCGMSWDFCMMASAGGLWTIIINVRWARAHRDVPVIVAEGAWKQHDAF